MKMFPSMSPRLHTAFEFLLYAILTALMLHATWLTWPDAFIDFSRELYLPWRVSCGDVLYRDLAYYFGPVSVYVNAGLFSLLGRPSIHALFALNFVFWVAILLVLRALLRRISSPLAATLSVAFFILLFSFNRYKFGGSFNYLAPYSHEITRGFLFSLLALLSMDSAWTPSPPTDTVPKAPFPERGPDRGDSTCPARMLLPGVFYALVLFTKPELALAATAAIALLFALHAWQRRRLPLPPLLAFVLATLATIAVVVTPFALVFHSLPRALHDTLLKLYLDAFHPALTRLPFFKGVLGIDAPFRHAARLLFGAACAAAPFLATRLLLPRLDDSPVRRFAVALLAIPAAALGFFAFVPLNAALAVAPAAFFLGAKVRARPLAAAFALFAFLLVSKTILNAGITFYGFVLSLPAFCCAVLWAFRPPCPVRRVLLAVALFLGFAVAALRLQTSTLLQWDITHPVHDAAILAPRLNRPFNAALDWIRANTPPDSTLAVFPEGAVLNVLSGRHNPTPYVSMPDTDWPRYDEADVLAAYSNHPPDTLILVHKTQDAAFGTDYAQSLAALLNPLYEPAFVVPLRLSSGESIPYLIIGLKK